MLSSLDSLVDDILIYLVTLLPISDVLKIRQTSKRFCALTKLRSVWCDKFFAEVLAISLPIPGNHLPLRDIPSEDLEWRTRRALQLDKHWQVHATTSPLCCAFSYPDERVNQIVLMPGGMDVLTVHPHKILCWRVDSTVGSENVVKQTGEHFLVQADCRVVRDSVRPDRIAIGSSHRQNGIIRVLSVGPGSALTQLTQHVPSPGIVVALHNNLLLMNVTDETATKGVVVVHSTLERRGSALLPHVPAYGDFVVCTFYANCIVILWESCLTVFPIPSIPEDSQVVVEPSQIFRLRQDVQAPASLTRCRPRMLPDTTVRGVASSKELDCLTILAAACPDPNAQPWNVQSNVVRSVLLPYDEANGLFSLASVPMHVDEVCTSMRIGPSGRGIWMEDVNVRQCSTRTIVGNCGILRTVDFDDYGSPLCRVPLTGDSAGNACLDFDDGMGRIAMVQGTDVRVIDLV